MKILFLSHYFPPEVNAPASRTFEHCSHWVRSGHDVDVITCEPNHPKGIIYPGFSNRLYLKEVKSGITVHRVWTYLTANEGFLKRTLNYISFMLASIICSLKVDNVSVVISTSPQFFNGLAGYFVSRLKGVPWVLEIRDLWPDSILAVGALKNRAIINMLKKIELFCYRKADRIVVVTDSFKSYMQELGVEGSKICIIKNGANLELFSADGIDVKQESSFISSEDLSNKFVAAYVGTHGMAHGLETLLEAAKLTRSFGFIHFLMVGDGAERSRLYELKRAWNLDNVTMISQQPKEMMPAIWRMADASLVLLKNTEIFESVIPSKIFESMAMKKPIILGVKGEVARMLAESNAGIQITPESASELSAAVIKLATDRNYYNQLSENGLTYVRENYDRRKLAGKFEELLADVLKQRRILDISSSITDK